MALAAFAAIWNAPARAEPAAPVFNWSGGYVGASLGYGRGDSTLAYENSDYFAELDPDGFFGGVYGGWNHQFANGLVAGLEGDVQISGIGSSDVLGYAGGIDTFRRFFADQDRSAALRARLGYSVDRFLPYVAGGLAVARYEHGETQHPVTAFTADATRLGWTLGAGVDFAMTDRLILRAEYRHSDFGSWRVTDTATYPHRIDLRTNELRLGVSYKF